MSFDSDKALMEAALRQLEGKIDYHILASDLGLTGHTATNTARMRWTRFKKRLNEDKSNNSTTPKKPATTPPPKTTSKITKAKPKGSSKKRKIDKEGEEEDILGIKDEFDDAESAVWEAELLQTPTRRLPGRAARVTTFKSEDSDDEEFQNLELGGSEIGGSIDAGELSGEEEA